MCEFMTFRSPCRLSADLKVACEILGMTIAGKKVHYRSLVDSLHGKVSESAVSHSLDTLTDWGIIRGHYGTLEGGRAGYLIEIDPCETEMVRKLYDEHWRQYCS